MCICYINVSEYVSTCVWVYAYLHVYCLVSGTTSKGSVHYGDVYILFILFICAWVYLHAWVYAYLHLYMAMCIYYLYVPEYVSSCAFYVPEYISTCAWVYIYMCLGIYLHGHCLVSCTTSKRVSRLIRTQALLVSKQGLNYDYTTVRLWRDGPVLGWCISG